MALVKFRSWTDWGYDGTDLKWMQFVSLTQDVSTNWHPIKLSFDTNRIDVYYDNVLMLGTNDIETNYPSFPSGGVSLDMWDTDPGRMMLITNVGVTH